MGKMLNLKLTLGDFKNRPRRKKRLVVKVPIDMSMFPSMNKQILLMMIDDMTSALIDELAKAGYLDA